MWVMAQSDPGQGFGTANIPAPQASAMKEILVGIFGAADGAAPVVPLRSRRPARAHPADDRGAAAGLRPRACTCPWSSTRRSSSAASCRGWWRGRRDGEDDAKVKARTDRGVLIASGLMAGGAIIGAVDAISSAIVKQVTGSTAAKNVIHILSDHAFEGMTGEIIGTITLVALCTFVVWFSRRAKARIVMIMKYEK